MSDKNFIKNITSKDINLSRNTIKNLIKTANKEQFEILCKSADFIFPFLKERIIKDFVKLINKEDLKAVFEFSKIYCCDFEDLIVNSWVKFATEDLTDEILSLFEGASYEQKAYCAKYFCYVADSVCIEYLNKYALCDYEPLKTNCALALAKFGDVEILNKAKETVLNSSDEFEKLNAYNFISTYGGDKQIEFVIKNAFSSPFLVNILSNILDFCDINHLNSILSKKTMTQIFHVLTEEYPEDLSLDSCYYWNFADFIKLIYGYKTNYSNNVLVLAREKFKEFSQNDVYTFDFDKNVKSEIKNIASLLSSLDLSVDNLCVYEDDFELDAVLGVVSELKLTGYAEFLADLFNKMPDEKKAQVALVLKEMNKVDLIGLEAVEKIENENVRILVGSYLR